MAVAVEASVVMVVRRAVEQATVLLAVRLALRSPGRLSRDWATSEVAAQVPGTLTTVAVVEVAVPVELAVRESSGPQPEPAETASSLTSLMM